MALEVLREVERLIKGMAKQKEFLGKIIDIKLDMLRCKRYEVKLKNVNKKAKILYIDTSTGVIKEETKKILVDSMEILVDYNHFSMRLYSKDTITPYYLFFPASTVENNYCFIRFLELNRDFMNHVIEKLKKCKRANEKAIETIKKKLTVFLTALRLLDS